MPVPANNQYHMQQQQQPIDGHNIHYVAVHICAMKQVGLFVCETLTKN